MNAAYNQETPSSTRFAPVHEQVAKMEQELSSQAACGWSATQIESYVEDEGRELQRRFAQAHLDLRTIAEQPVQIEGSDGVQRTKQRESRRPLRLVFGEVETERTAYQARSVAGLHPSDGVLNLPKELYSHGVRRLVAETAATNSFEETVAHIATYTGATIGKRQVEELAQRSAVDFEAFYTLPWEEREDADDLLVLTFDGKGIAMRKEDLRPATRKAAEQKPRKLATRLTSGEKRNRKRMAQVAAVYSIEPFERTPADVLHELRHLRDVNKQRPRPFNKRVWASVAREPKDVIREAFDEALTRDPDKRRRWVVLVDGNNDQIQLIQKEARRCGVEIAIVLDFIHVLEYLWKAAHCFHDAGSQEAETWVHLRMLALLEGRTGGYVARGMRRLAKARDLPSNALATIEQCAKYLVNKTHLIKYADALETGLPIATGVIEGACRHLIQDRMGRTGARWSLSGAEAVLKLRALRTSGDFDEYWTFHLERELERNPKSRYAGGKIPNPIPRVKPRLRRVK